MTEEPVRTTDGRAQPVKEIAEEVRHKHWSPWEVVSGLVALGLTIAFIVLAIVFQDDLANTDLIARFGLLGLVVISFVAASAFSVTAIPVPYWLLTLTLPGIIAPTYGAWSPVWVGVLTAAGATAGQFVTYLIGLFGKGLAARITARFSGNFYDKAGVWMKRHGGWTVFFMSVTPNPIHLPMTLAIATLRYPWLRFMLFGFLGQLMKSMVLAFVGYYSIQSLLKIGALEDPLVMALAIAGVVFFGLALWQLVVWALETRTKRQQYRAAEEYARKAGKQLLVIGGPWGVQPARRWLGIPAHRGGDVCLDITRKAVEGHTCPIVASATDIPFEDKAFGAVFLSHVLEHLPTPEAARRAIQEMNRVGDAVFLVYPSRQSIAAWIITDHHLWVWQEGNRIYLQQRRKRGKKERLVVETGSTAV